MESGCRDELHARYCDNHQDGGRDGTLQQEIFTIAHKYLMLNLWSCVILRALIFNDPRIKRLLNRAFVTGYSPYVYSQNEFDTRPIARASRQSGHCHI